MNAIPEAIEASARAYYDHVEESLIYPGEKATPWDEAGGDVREAHLRQARVHVEAAAPILTAPRTVTTHKELDALPADSVVLDGQGLALVSGGDGQWHVGINGDIWHAPAVMYHGPATVLWTPVDSPENGDPHGV